MQSAHSRPGGPRLPRPISPSPYANLPETAPLNIRPRDPSVSLSPPQHNSSNGNGAVISRSTTPTPNRKPQLKLLPVSNGGQTHRDRSESPPRDGYQRPSGQPNGLDGESSTDATIRPPVRIGEIPRRPPLDAMGDIRRTLEEIENKTSGSSVGLEGDDNLKLSNPTQWSDDVLEEVERLGEGAGGAVHKVRDRRTGQIMARKTITTREAPMKQLLRELEIISSTTHPNIVLFYGAYISPSSSEVKVLMELGEGGSLEAIGKRIKDRGGRVSEKVAGRVAIGILDGLDYLHQKKTIHRDIKPSNILLSRDGLVKLCDFGVSGELVDSMAGTFTGTSFYMAPERISGHSYSIRSDVWSTGISLLELVLNRFPFPNELPPIELMMYITQSEPPRLEDEEGYPKWSDAMKDFIKQTLTIDAHSRPTPKIMLAHPWVVQNKKEKVNMARWVGEIWGWPKEKKSRDSASRPNSSASRPGSSRLGDTSATSSLSARTDTDSPPRTDS